MLCTVQLEAWLDHVRRQGLVRYEQSNQIVWSWLILQYNTSIIFTTIIIIIINIINIIVIINIIIIIIVIINIVIIIIVIINIIIIINSCKSCRF